LKRRRRNLGRAVILVEKLKSAVLVHGRQNMCEFDYILDDWHLLKKAGLKSRKQVGNLVRTTYAPKHSQTDEQSPLWWRKEALRNKWFGYALDATPMDGSAMFGICSVLGITYVTYISNLRHRERLEMAVRIFGMKVRFCESMEELVSIKGFLIR